MNVDFTSHNTSTVTIHYPVTTKPMDDPDTQTPESGGTMVPKPSPYFPVCLGGEIIPGEGVEMDELADVIA